MSHPQAPPNEILRHRLSSHRFERYVRAVPDGSSTSALGLYRWNLEVSAAFYRDIGMFEVVLRNALVEQLETKYGPDWWRREQRGAAPLSERTWEDIETAISRATSGRADAPTPTPRKVVAELTLGFWRFLLTNTYRGTLWPNGLEHAFPHRHSRDRQALASAVRQVNELRNRVAHYEPLFAHDLLAERTRILGVSAQICPRTAAWLATESTVLGIMARRPLTNVTPRRRSRRGGRRPD